jgi:hypothetical protein
VFYVRFAFDPAHEAKSPEGEHGREEEAARPIDRRQAQPPLRHRPGQHKCRATFGSSAILGPSWRHKRRRRGGGEDPWLCGPGFGRVGSCRGMDATVGRCTRAVKQRTSLRFRTARFESTRTSRLGFCKHRLTDCASVAGDPAALHYPTFHRVHGERRAHREAGTHRSLSTACRELGGAAILRPAAPAIQAPRARSKDRQCKGRRSSREDRRVQG